MDDDDKKPKDAAAKPARDGAHDADAKLREVSEEELRRIVDAHKISCETGGNRGEKADLSLANLREADLQAAFLTGADLRGADLCGANLEEAFLDGANLQGANLQRANLSRAMLQGADLRQANLREADLQDAKLAGAKLHMANLQGANLVSSKIQKAYLRKANLQGANLRSANLEGTDLSDANLQRAELGGANLQDADLSYAKFQLAQLFDTNLKGANLLRADLQEAFLIRADLQGAKAAGANLREAKLIEANLENAKFPLTDFRNADLSDAQLSDVIGLHADQLAGANLSNAKLSNDIAAFDGLARVEEISRIARPIFIGLLAGCVYSWLTIATTTDARLLTNSSSSPLPIIGTEIPIAGFYWVAPILLLGVYVYLHLYLQRLWEGLADLPAVFPDGKPLNKEVYPWLLSGLVRAHFKLLKDERTFLSRMENWATIFLAWWIVPVTVLVFWLRYLPRHDWFGTGLHVALLILSIGSAILLHRHAVGTLRRDVIVFRWRRRWLDRRTYQGAVAVGLGVVFVLVSLGAIKGDVPRTIGKVDLGGPWTWVPTAIDRVGYRTFANFRKADVSTKPATWTGLAELPPEELKELGKTLVEKARAELGQVKGARLERADLRHVDAFGAFLAKADLPGAKLLGANLSRANLQRANLLSAVLYGARLRQANLQGADLRNANLQMADLSRANLQGARLIGANLQGARLNHANLRGADLSEARNLTREQLDEACGDEKTKLPDDLADYQMKACP